MPTPADAATHPSLTHRRVLAPSAPLRPFAGTDLLQRIGGPAAVAELVAGLYDRIETDAVLRPLFGPDLSDERAHQRAFFSEFLGGPADYSASASTSLLERHRPVPIPPAAAARWLGHFQHALQEAVTDADAARSIAAAIQRLALAFVNTDRPAGPAHRRVKDSLCHRHHPLNQATVSAGRGDAAALGQLLGEHPGLFAQPSAGAQAMQAAVLAGQLPTVRLLLDAGVAASTPRWIPAPAAYERLVFITPLCAARWKRRDAIAQALIAAGAVDDIFSAAFLGDRDALTSWWKHDPTLIDAWDPACDVVAMPVMAHAIAQGRYDALRQLLEHGAALRDHGRRELRAAAERLDQVSVDLLITRGADASAVGPGRWAMDRALADRLVAAGATVADPSHRWIWISCTGNNRQRDDPAYVQALLRHGTRVDDRYRGATALHYAARAGFIGVVRALLDAGADPGATDAAGATPAGWADICRDPRRGATVRSLLT